MIRSFRAAMALLVAGLLCICIGHGSAQLLTTHAGAGAPVSAYSPGDVVSRASAF